jgi:hypothetical protein
LLAGVSGSVTVGLKEYVVPTTTVVFGVPEMVGAAACASDANKEISDAAISANNEFTLNECTPLSGARTLELNIDNPRGAALARQRTSPTTCKPRYAARIEVLRQPRLPR